jgi:pimeloyl-ACP methyl ester carboxylesterase
MKKKINLRANNVTLSYQHKGTGDFNIILIHGWCINSSYWDEQVSFLSNSYNVYTLDLPGFGDSKAKRENWTIEEYALDVLDFIKTLGLSNIIIVGHSMSGDIMLEMVIKSSGKIIGIIGIDNLKSAGTPLSDDINYQIERLIERLHIDYKTTIQAYADNFLFMPSTSEEVRKRIKQDFAEADPTVSISTFRNLMSHSDKLGELLQLSPLKLFLINSDAIPTDEMSLAVNCKNGYEVLYIHDTGHYPMIEKTQEFNILLSQAISKIIAR